MKHQDRKGNGWPVNSTTSPLRWILFSSCSTILPTPVLPTRKNLAAATLPAHPRTCSPKCSRTDRPTPARVSSCFPAMCTTTSATSTVASPTLLRSEEHTSELQSHLNLVCRLLLEKKK